MEEVKLEVQVRNAIGTRKAKEIRRNDMVPGVVYGGKKESVAVQIDRPVAPQTKPFPEDNFCA